MKSYKSIVNKKILFVIIIIFYITRIVFLDADAYSYSLNQIQPIDEMYYNEVAYKMESIGILDFFSNGAGHITIPNSKTYLLPQLITGFLCLFLEKIFILLRLTNVFLGVSCLVLVIKVLGVLINDEKRKTCTQIIAAVLFVFDFNILTLTRSAIPIIPCMLAEIAFLFLLIDNLNNARKLGFVLGGPVISFCLIYMGLPFLILSGGIILLYMIFKHKKERLWITNIIISYVIGLLVGLIATEILSEIVFREHISDLILDTLYGFGGKINSSLSSSIKTYIRNAFKFFMSNMFRYNFILLLMFGASILFYISKVLKKAGEAEFIMLTIIMSHWLMTIIVDNQTLNKASISYCTVLILSVYNILNENNKIKTVHYLYFIAAFIVNGGSFVFEPNPFSKKFILIILFISIIIIFLFVLWKLEDKHKYNQKFLVSILVIVTFFEMGLSIKYVYYNPSFDDKQICKDIGEKVADESVIGGFPLGFALYNDIEPSFGYYSSFDMPSDPNYVMKQYSSVVPNYPTLYYLGYKTGNELKKINAQLKDSPYYFKIIKEYNRTYFSYSKGDSDIILCKRMKRLQ